MQYDYIIVGGGSAGCVLANRLSEDPDVQVLLLEAGPTDSSLKLKIPGAFIYNYTSPKHNWMYHTEPDPHLDGKRVFCPRGKVLGGSSSINGLAFVRGHASDFDDWAKQGLPSWSYAHCLPYFRRMETFSGGADVYRGGTGPLRVYRPKHKNPLYGVFLEACEQANHPFSKDTNGYQQEGFGPMDQSIYKGVRSSTARAYLNPAKRRYNLTIKTNCWVTKVIFKGVRAVGVEYEKSGKQVQSYANEEIILSAGAVNTPQLLLVSGVGPARQLQEFKIKVIADLPGVGKNLQEHYDFSVQQECSKPWSVNPEMSPLGVMKNGLKWLAFKDGPAATNQSEVAGYVRTRSSDRPDLQICFMPMAFEYEKMRPIAGHGFRLFSMPLRPTSVGHVKLKSANPRLAPSILCNYLSTENDRQDFRDLIEISRNIIAQKPFDWVRGGELEPGSKLTTNRELDAFVRKYGKPTHHLCGTCKMGIDDYAVVDEQLRVRQTEGLRVVDASVMPNITSGNINAPTIMLAEKGSDYLANRNPLAPKEVAVYKPPSA